MKSAILTISLMMASTMFGQQVKPDNRCSGCADLGMPAVTSQTWQCDTGCFFDPHPQEKKLSYYYNGKEFMACEDTLGMCDATGAIKVISAASTVVKLSDDEYSNLQKLRQAVIDEEKRLAVKYGWQGDRAIGDAISPSIEHLIPADHYEFHQQFLLIDKGAK